MPLAIAIDLDEQLGGVSGRRGVGVEQDVLVLCQVLGGRLLGSAGTVQQLPLQQREVGLQNKHRAGLQQGKGLSSCSKRFGLHQYLKAVTPVTHDPHPGSSSSWCLHS